MKKKSSLMFKTKRKIQESMEVSSDSKTRSLKNSVSAENLTSQPQYASLPILEAVIDESEKLFGDCKTLSELFQIVERSPDVDPAILLLDIKQYNECCIRFNEERKLRLKCYIIITNFVLVVISRDKKVRKTKYTFEALINLYHSEVSIIEESDTDIKLISGNDSMIIKDLISPGSWLSSIQSLIHNVNQIPEVVNSTNIIMVNRDRSLTISEERPITKRVSKTKVKAHHKKSLSTQVDRVSLRSEIRGEIGKPLRKRHSYTVNKNSLLTESEADLSVIVGQLKQSNSKSKKLRVPRLSARNRSLSKSEVVSIGIVKSESTSAIETTTKQKFL